MHAFILCKMYKNSIRNVLLYLTNTHFVLILKNDLQNASTMFEKQFTEDKKEG